MARHPPAKQPQPLGPYATALAIEAEAERARCQASLRYFMRQAWRHLEPKRELIWGWHIDAILEHVQAALLGEIEELVVNIPPRHIKSTLISIIAPTWLWARKPEARFLTCSYSLGLALRDATRSRKLINSSWYQRTFPGTALVPYQRAKGRYETTEGGWRVASSILGIGTGEGGDTVMVDDPIKARDAKSEVKIQSVLDWWDETMPTRLDDPDHGSRIVVMQRLHERDLTGHILAEANPNTVHLCLPARFDPSRKMSTPWFTDPRTKVGEPLWPERFGHAQLARLERRMTPNAVAGQLQQSPAQDGGNVLKRDWWRIWTEPVMPQIEFLMLSVDPSVKDKEINDPWAVTVWGLFQHVDDVPDHKADLREEWHLMLLRSYNRHLSYPTAKRFITQLVSNWTFEDEPPDVVLIEDKASGPNLITELRLAGIENVMAWNPGKDSKITRAVMASDFLYAGRVWVPGKKLGPDLRSADILPIWGEDVVDQCARFTGAADGEDDLVDTVTQAIIHVRKIGYLHLDSDEDDWQEVETTPRARDRESAYG